MKILLDTGYYSYTKAFAYLRNPRINIFDMTDAIVRDNKPENIIFAIDSPYSLRKIVNPQYKAQRKGKQPELVKAAHDIAYKLQEKYEGFCVCEDGLEADDIIAKNATDDDWILCNDKDFLGMRSYATLCKLDWKPWGIERLADKHVMDYGLKRGEKALVYQLIYGDVADNIPRCVDTYDRETGPEILKHHSPLKRAVELLPELWVRQSLNALMLPTPLDQPHIDPIEIALEMYYENC